MSIKSVLINRDGLSAEQADEKIAEAKEVLSMYLETNDLEYAYNVCMEEFGLEPDYLMELI